MMLTGKKAIVTGARTGIGQAVLRLFAAQGCDCWAVIHREDEAFAARCREMAAETGVRIEPVAFDLESSEAVREGMKRILKESEGVDFLINAAGTVSPARLFTMTPISEIKRVMEVNFFSALEMCQLAGRAMLRKKRGSIVNITSVSAAGNDGAQLEYAASKAALECATKKLARELGPSGIRVNAVSPGLTDTKMLQAFSPEALDSISNNTGLKRLGTPEEIAEACLFLCSDRASFITGEILHVDGGSY